MTYTGTIQQNKFLQTELKRHGYYAGAIDGILGPKSQAAQAAYLYWLYGGSIAQPEPVVATAPPYPAMSDVERTQMFGNYDWKHVNGGDDIYIFGSWESDNIITVDIPQLRNVGLFDVDGPRFSGKVRLHRLVAPQFKAFFKEVEARGMLDRILTFDGAFVARTMRGYRSTLSNHAFGTAMDLNAGWNGLGKTPAPAGSYGSLVELVPIMHKFGLFWGGNFSGRKDGMHLEVAKVLDL